MMGDGGWNLPPGFRFSPSDEELVLHFLHRKASLLPCHPDIIPDIALHRPLDPWDLDGKALSSGGQLYFFGRRMDNQITENGFWKSVGTEQPICSDGGLKRVGTKKTLVYHIGQPPVGAETDWAMHEYHLCDDMGRGTSSHKGRNIRLRHSSEWVLRRVYKEKPSSPHPPPGQASVYSLDNDCDEDGGSDLSCLDELYLSLDDTFDDFN